MCVKYGNFLDQSRTHGVGRGPSGPTFVPTPVCRRSLLMHFQHDGSEGLMKTKLLILRERLNCHIAVTCRVSELSVCGWGREHKKM